jgi:hypothetical protein
VVELVLMELEEVVQVDIEIHILQKHLVAVEVQKQV